MLGPRHYSILLLMLLRAACCAFADDEPCIQANPNRPTVSNPADITEYGVLELEAGVTLNDQNRNLSDLLKFAVLKDLELRFTSVPITEDPESGITGFGDVTAGFQYRFLHQSSSLPSMALFYGVKFPTAKDGLGSGKYDQDILWLVSKDFGKIVHADFNLDFQFLGRQSGSGVDTVYAPAFAVSFNLPHNLQPAAEISGTSRQNSAHPATATFMLALSYSLTPRLVFDSAVAFGLHGGLPTATYLGGVTYSIADLYHRCGK